MSTAPVTLYTTQWCPFCIRAKQLLDRKGAAYREISVDGQPELRQEMMRKSGQFTVPQIWIGDRHVGGCDELFALERAGQLDALLRDAGQPD
ncbi:glutaredoxin 3 [Saccharospirillum salsuginis]|uniref:Glutaredoxin n=1 Tax=Saccharospirillum salsuginis TaxID=418750 RepID=A0A918N7Z7_9GAMM|nr:glutaredoxin 3 [Saccharospirillum salsuginis]GGX46080.1 glutaredoxin [Saccharospirillum salsuginis]